VLGSLEQAAALNCATAGMSLAAALLLQQAGSGVAWHVPRTPPPWWQLVGGPALGIFGVVLPVLAGEVLGMAAYFVCRLVETAPNPV
jgi:uncharacterized membrane protein YdcZ (DUF606 family)